VYFYLNKFIFFFNSYSLVASGSTDNLAKLWFIGTLAYNREIQFIAYNHSSIRNCITNKNGYFITTNSKDIKIWNETTFNLIKTIDNKNSITSIAELPDGNFATGSYDKNVIIWNGTSLEPITTLESQSIITSMLVLRNDTLLTVSNKDHVFILWNLSTCQLLNSFNLSIDQKNVTINLLYLLSNDFLAVTTAENKNSHSYSIYICNSTSFTLINKLSYHNDIITGIHQLKNSSLVTSSLDSAVKIWNIETFLCISTLKERSNIVSSAILQDYYLIVGFNDGSINIRNLNDFQLEATINQHEQSVNGLLIFSNKLISYSLDSSLCVWSFNKSLNVTLKNDLKHSNPVLSVQFLKNTEKNEKYLLTSCENDPNINVWDIRIFKIIKSLVGHSQDVNILAKLTSDLIASSSLDGTIIIWNDYLDLNYELESKHFGKINAIAFSSNLSIMISASMDKKIIVWQTSKSLTHKYDLKGHSKQIESIAILNKDIIATASDDQMIKLWNITYSHLKPILTLTHLHTDNINSLTFLENGNLISASKDKTVIIWDKNGYNNQTFLCGHFKSVICLLAINQYILSGSCDKTIIVWNIYSMTYNRTIKGHTDCVNALVEYKRKYVLSGSDDKTVKIWDLASFSLIKTLNQYSDVNALASFYSINNCYFSIASGSNIINYGEKYYNKINITLSSSFQQITKLAILSNGDFISASQNGKILFFNKTFNETNKIDAHKQNITSLLILSDDRFVSGSCDKLIKIWDNKINQTLRGHNTCITSLAYLHDAYLISGDKEGIIKVWTLNLNDSFEFNRNLTLNDENSTAQIHSLVFMQNKSLISGHRKMIAIWDYPDLKLMTKLIISEGVINCLAILKNGDIVVGNDDTVEIYDRLYFRLQHSLEGHGSLINSVVVLENQKIVSAGDDNCIKVWNSDSFEIMDTLVGHTSSITSLVSYNETLISGSLDETIRIWNFDEFHFINIMKGHKDLIFDLKYLKNGDLASCSLDKTIRIWDMNLYTNIFTNRMHKRKVLALDIFPNGDLASASEDLTVKIFNTNLFYNLAYFH